MSHTIVRFRLPFFLALTGALSGALVACDDLLDVDFSDAHPIKSDGGVTDGGDNSQGGGAQDDGGNRVVVGPRVDGGPDPSTPTQCADDTLFCGNAPCNANEPVMNMPSGIYTRRADGVMLLVEDCAERGLGCIHNASGNDSCGAARCPLYGRVCGGAPCFSKEGGGGWTFPDAIYTKSHNGAIELIEDCAARGLSCIEGTKFNATCGAKKCTVGSRFCGSAPCNSNEPQGGTNLPNSIYTKPAEGTITLVEDCAARGLRCVRSPSGNDSCAQ
jgi:hypothetical protein